MTELPLSTPQVPPLRHTAKRRWIYTLLALSVLALYGYASLDPQPPMPKAAQGVIDLSTWDFERQGPVRLDGQWEVRWERLLEPAELAALDQSPSELATPAQAAPDQTAPSYANVPGPWSQNKPGASALNATGCATMRLLVHNLPTAGQTALRLTNICTAWTLWVNGRQLAHSGIPAEKDHIEEPRLSSMVIPLPPTRPRLLESYL